MTEKIYPRIIGMDIKDYFDKGIGGHLRFWDEQQLEAAIEQLDNAKFHYVDDLREDEDLRACYHDALDDICDILDLFREERNER